MNGVLLSTIISVLIGGTLMVNGLSIDIDDILNQTYEAANGANLHQIATALEMYYLENDSYPIASDGTTLVDALYDDNIISGKPLDSNVFDYESIDGQNYTLRLN